MMAYEDISKAIRAGQDGRAIALINRDPEGARHWKTIMDAAYVGAPKVVRALLAAGADPDAVSGTGHRHTPLIRCLHSQSTFRRTPGHTEVLSALLEGGADPNLPGGMHRFPPLAEACVGGYAKDIELLLNAGAAKTLHVTAMLCDAAGLKRRLKKVDPDTLDHAGRTPLHYLALSGLWRNSEKFAKASLACAEALLDAGAAVDRIDQHIGAEGDFRPTALWRAAGWQRHHALARLLLEAGAEPSNAVFAVTFEGDHEMLQMLLDYGADLEITVHGRTPLIDLLYYKRPDNVPWLLEHGANVGATDAAGRNALHYAAMQGVRAQIAQCLIDHGADRDAIDKHAKTPLDYAKEKARAKLIPLLQARSVSRRKAGENASRSRG
jgi:ankyrin repeat protein